MLLPKINSKVYLTIFLIFSNFWAIKIFNLNIFLGLVLVLITITLILNYKKRMVLALCALTLTFIQIYTTDIPSLINLDNDHQRIQQQRIRSYPPTYFDLYFKVIWLKPEKWIEENNLIIALSRIEENFFKVLNINSYFFGGTPRNSQSDFEKFPYVVLPFFVLGVIDFINKRRYKELFFLYLMPLLIISFIGSTNPYGQLSLFPGVLLAIQTGIVNFSRHFKNQKIYYVVACSLIFIIFLQQISYA